MKIEVHFYSRLRDLAGCAQCVLDLPDSATVAYALAQVYADHPAIRPWDAHLLLAIGLDYAARDQPLRAGDALSVMPPVQGG